MQQAWARAIEAGDAIDVGRLLDARYDIDALDEHGQTGLLLASTHGRTEVVRTLIERGAKLDVAAKYNLTALMLAIVAAPGTPAGVHEEIAIALIEAGADLDHPGSGAPGFAGLTALDLARARDLNAVVAAIEARTRTEGATAG